MSISHPSASTLDQRGDPGPWAFVVGPEVFRPVLAGLSAPSSAICTRDVAAAHPDSTNLHINVHSPDDVVRVAAAYLQCRRAWGAARDCSVCAGIEPGGPGRRANRLPSRGRI